MQAEYLRLLPRMDQHRRGAHIQPWWWWRHHQPADRRNSRVRVVQHIIVAVKLAVIFLFIGVGIGLHHRHNWQPSFHPIREWGDLGVGVLRAAG